MVFDMRFMPDAVSSSPRARRPERRPAPTAALGDKVAALKSPAAFPEPTRAVQAIETHMSWVFLTDTHAYKLKKPVRYAFLDFGSLAARKRHCAAEIRLNRRLAASVYLGVVPLTRDARGRLRVGGRGGIVDWLVKMRRLPADKALSRMLANDTIDRTALRRSASLLATFYRRIRPVRISAAEYRKRFRLDLHQSFRELRKPEYGLSLRRLGRIAATLHAFLNRRGELIGQRARAGRIVEGHGDLRPDHVFLTRPTPFVIDCLEFRRSFRIVDPVDELAFLGMECRRLGNAEIGNTFLEAYERITGDRPAPELVAFYRIYRACQRAKLAAWHTEEPNSAGPAHWLALARTYLRLAEQDLGDIVRRGRTRIHPRVPAARRSSRRRGRVESPRQKAAPRSA